MTNTTQDEVVVICPDIEKRHEGTFPDELSAKHWAEWGHICMAAEQHRIISADVLAAWLAPRPIRDRTVTIAKVVDYVNTHCAEYKTVEDESDSSDPVRSYYQGRRHALGDLAAHLIDSVADGS